MRNSLSGGRLLNSLNNPNWTENNHLLLHFPSRRGRGCKCGSAVLLILQPSFYVSIMARQQPVFLYDVWTSAPRTRRGHLSDLVSVTVHQVPQRGGVRWMIRFPGRLPSQPDATLTDSDAPEWTDEPQCQEQVPQCAWNLHKSFAVSLVLVFTGLDMKIHFQDHAGERWFLMLGTHRELSRPTFPGSQLDSQCKKVRKTTAEISAWLNTSWY